MAVRRRRVSGTRWTQLVRKTSRHHRSRHATKSSRNYRICHAPRDSTATRLSYPRRHHRHTSNRSRCCGCRRWCVRSRRRSRKKRTYENGWNNRISRMRAVLCSKRWFVNRGVVKQTDAYRTSGQWATAYFETLPRHIYMKTTPRTEQHFCQFCLLNGPYVQHGLTWPISIVYSVYRNVRLSARSPGLPYR